MELDELEKKFISNILSKLTVNPSSHDAEAVVAMVKGILAKIKVEEPKEANQA